MTNNPTTADGVPLLELKTPFHLLFSIETITESGPHVTGFVSDCVDGPYSIRVTSGRYLVTIDGKRFAEMADVFQSYEKMHDDHIKRVSLMLEDLKAART